MIQKAIVIGLVIVAIIFFLGFIGHLIYLIITPAHKLTLNDLGKKNILFNFLKIKKK